VTKNRINVDLSVEDGNVSTELQQHHLIFYFNYINRAVAFARVDVIKLRDAINEWLIDDDAKGL